MDSCERSCVGFTALGSVTGSYPNDAIPPFVIFLLYQRTQLMYTKKCASTKNNWWTLSDSNRSPPACKAGALPDELRAQYFGAAGWNRTTDKWLMRPPLYRWATATKLSVLFTTHADELNPQPNVGSADGTAYLVTICSRAIFIFSSKRISLWMTIWTNKL